jgi:hypothetical protein
MWFVFDPMSLIFVIAGCFMAGFLPLLVIVGMTPEAKTFIKSKMTGGVIISKSNDAGYREFICVQPYGSEGQFIGGRNAFGQREIYVRPQSSSPLFSKSFVLKGIRRPILDAYEGKTIVVPASVLAAIQVAESNKAELPAHIKKWAEENQITIKETVTDTKTVTAPTDPTQPEGSQMTVTNSKTKTNFVTRTLFLINPLNLNSYFQAWYNQSQFDVLLQKADMNGYMRGLGLKKEGGGGSKKWFIVGIVVLLAMAGVGIVLLASGGLHL